MPQRDLRGMAAQRPSLLGHGRHVPARPDADGAGDLTGAHAVLRGLPRSDLVVQRGQEHRQYHAERRGRRRGLLLPGLPQHRAGGRPGQRRLHGPAAAPLPLRAHRHAGGEVRQRLSHSDLPAPASRVVRAIALQDAGVLRRLPQAVPRHGGQHRHREGAGPEPVRQLEEQPLVSRGRSPANRQLPGVPHAAGGEQ